ncbi:transposase [Streptomyces zhihengii]|uniref:transposase n=1 Tax=Streptomyces zhihengii TaxID=1818004 RepID=UPI003557B35F
MESWWWNLRRASAARAWARGGWGRCTGPCVRSTSHVGRYLWGGHFWSGSYFTGSCGGAPLTVLNQYIENQKRPA